MVPSLDARRYLKAPMRLCSWDAGCRQEAQYRVGSPGPLCAYRREDQRLRRADAYLRNQLAEPISLAALAQVAGLSRFHLLRLFKTAYGETPLKRLTRLRMAEARRLLRRSGRSITEIALQCGYGNPAHFAALFRRQVGVSPSQYRASH